MNSKLSHENRIQWLVQESDLPLWVRQVPITLVGRKGLDEAERTGIEVHGEKIYGYSELSDAASPEYVDEGVEYFHRRLFVVRELDFQKYAEGVCPSEAAEPLSIEPGVKGISPYKKNQVGVRLPKALMWKLNAYSQLVNSSQTDIILQALEEYLNKPLKQKPIEDRVSKLEQRMNNIEQHLNLSGI
jgi:hypothetical protein